MLIKDEQMTDDMVDAVAAVIIIAIIVTGVTYWLATH